MHSDWERSGASAPKSSQIIREKCIWFLNWRRGEQTCACYLVSFTHLNWLYLHLRFFGSYRSHQEDSKAKITTKTHHTSVCALAMLTDRFGVTRLPVICIQIVSWCMWKRRKACDPWNTFCPIITVALKYNRLVAKHNIY